MRKIRNKDCHLFENTMTNPVSAPELLESYKAWLYVVNNLSPELRKILDNNCGGTDTVNEIINYLSNNCNISDGVDEYIVDWFYN